MKKTILIAFGTRPEALKFVPLIRALRAAPEFKCFVCLTGQHREMLDQVIRLFKIEIDADLCLMQNNQTLEYISGKVITKFGKVLKQIMPDLVFVQGDTATALMAAIASFYSKTPVAHLEAGLRSRNKFHPFPEEINRTLISHVADYHFTPTTKATQNLLTERIPKKTIFQVGNSIVDTIEIAKTMIKTTYPIFRNINMRKRILFVTAHRRESFGRGLEEIFSALRTISRQFKGVEIIYPVHLNPQVARPARATLGRAKGIHLMRPFTYEETCWVMKHCFAILTDSGGIQEEAPSFQKPVLVLRNVTERPEGVRAGIAKLVGTDCERIVRTTKKLLSSPRFYHKMIPHRNPYGDGRSTRRILSHLRNIFYDLDKKG